MCFAANSIADHAAARSLHAAHMGELRTEVDSASSTIRWVIPGIVAGTIASELAVAAFQWLSAVQFQFFAARRTVACWTVRLLPVHQVMCVGHAMLSAASGSIDT